MFKTILELFYLTSRDFCVYTMAGRDGVWTARDSRKLLT